MIIQRREFLASSVAATLLGSVTNIKSLQGNTKSFLVLNVSFCSNFWDEQFEMEQFTNSFKEMLDDGIKVYLIDADSEILGNDQFLHCRRHRGHLFHFGREIDYVKWVHLPTGLVYRYLDKRCGQMVIERYEPSSLEFKPWDYADTGLAHK